MTASFELVVAGLVELIIGVIIELAMIESTALVVMGIVGLAEALNETWNEELLMISVPDS